MVVRTSAVVLCSLFLLAAEPVSAAEESAAGSLGALGIAVSLKPPAGIGSADAQVVYFIRPESGESLDSALARGQLIATNEAHDGRLFVLGAPPGTYVAVAAAYHVSKAGTTVPIASAQPSRNVRVSVGYDPFASEDVFRTYFARDVIESTAVIVLPDSFVWAGDLEVKQSMGIAKGDPVQKHFQEILEGKAAKSSGFMRAMSGTHSYRGSLRELLRDPPSEAKFLDKAWKKLRKSEWAPLLEKRRTTLQAVLPAGR